MVRDRYPPRPARRHRSAALALIVVSWLAGCADYAREAPSLGNARFEAVSTGEADRRERIVIGESGETLALTSWHPAHGSPRAVILAVHGFGDYGPSTFADAALEWSEADIATYAYDQRGFGRNPSNADWPGHRALTDDLGTIATLVAAENRGAPFVLLGHSMGGAVVSTAIGEGSVRPDAAVLLAPAWWGGPNLGPLLRSIAFGVASVAPDRRWTGDGVVRIQASDNIPMLRALGDDPLYVGNPSAREFVGLIRLMDRAWQAAPGMDVPLLVLYGARDEVVPEDALRATFARIPGDATFEIAPDGWHMLLRDLKGEAVRGRVLQFVEGVTGPAG